MRQLQDIQKEQNDMAIIVQLTNSFESLASIRIAQVKNQVLEAQQFFNALWHIYTQIRVDTLFRFGRNQADVTIDKELFIVISSAGGFSGDIDQRLVQTLLKEYDAKKHDIIVIGRHGATLLTQQNIAYKKYFQLPEKDRDINVEPLVREIRQYKNAIVYYQTYVSLMVQEVKRLELVAAIQQLSDQAGKADEIISEKNYIFEPDAFAVVAHLERSMLQITLSQVIFDSKLAQYASRFRAMTVANDRATESLGGLRLLYNRTKRSIRDEQLKQIVTSLKKVRATQ